MHISYHDIDPQLRGRGVLLRALLRGRRGDFFIRAGNRFMRMFMTGGQPKGLRCHSEYIPRDDGSRMRVVVFPAKGSANPPALLWLHGGGYSLGIPEVSFRAPLPALLRATGCAAVLPDYTLSGERPYPAALEDAYLALRWMRDNAQRLGADPQRLFVGGESAGGGLAAALCLAARDRGELSVSFQMPIYPMLDDRMSTPSARDNNAPCWDSEANAEGWERYLKGVVGEPPIYAAPGRATDLAGMPPAATFVGSLEPFRDETRAYVEGLRAAGTAVAFQEYEGAYHAFDMMCPKADASRRAVAFAVEALQRACEGKPIAK